MNNASGSSNIPAANAKRVARAVGACLGTKGGAFWDVEIEFQAFDGDVVFE
jgi:hypothetical protein